MPVRNVPVTEVGPLARDVMLRSPETVPGDMTVGAARRLLESPRMRMLLVADGDRFAGVIPRERLADEPDGTLTLDRLADSNSPRVRPDATVARVLDLLETADSDRIPVVDANDRLLGLVCFNSRKRHFCLDAVS